MNNASDDLRLRAEYDAAMKVWTQLVDVRFKLLAITPIATGLALKGQPTAPIGALGLVVALSVVGYEIRNSQLHDNAVHRLKWLEKQLNSPSSVKANAASGIVGDTRAGERLKVMRWVMVIHDRALAGIYGSTVGAWAAIVTEGISKHWARWNVGRWFSFGVGTAAAATTALTIVRASKRGRAVEPVENLHKRASAELKEVASVVKYAPNRWKELNPRASAEAVKLAEELGFIERHERWISPRKPVVGDWWIDKAAISRADATKEPPDSLSWATMRRLSGRPGVRVRRPKVTVRRTPWGELLDAAPTDAGRAERERLLRKHLSARIIGSELLADDQLGALGVLAAGTGNTASGATSAPATAPEGSAAAPESQESGSSLQLRSRTRPTADGGIDTAARQLAAPGALPQTVETPVAGADAGKEPRAAVPPFVRAAESPAIPEMIVATSALALTGPDDPQAGVATETPQTDHGRFYKDGRPCPPC